jgi:hypothetical protein
MMKWQLDLEVRIMYFPPYPCSGGASRIGEGRVELCAQRIPQDLVGFCVSWCVSSDLRLSSLAMVAGLEGLSTTTSGLSTTTSFVRLR